MLKELDLEYLIDGEPIPLPDAPVKLTTRDLSAPDAGLDEGGFYHGSLLRSGLRTWELSYQVLCGEDLWRLQSLVGGKSTLRFRFRQLGGLPGEVICRPGPLEAQFYDRGKDLYRSVRLRLEEC